MDAVYPTRNSIIISFPSTSLARFCPARWFRCAAADQNNQKRIRRWKRCWSCSAGAASISECTRSYARYEMLRVLVAKVLSRLYNNVFRCQSSLSAQCHRGVFSSQSLSLFQFHWLRHGSAERRVRRCRLVWIATISTRDHVRLYGPSLRFQSALVRRAV